MINIEGLDRADVLVALYNGSRPQGMGFMHYDPKPMLKEEAELLLQQQHYFDYLKGRVMKVSLKDEKQFSGSGYDRDNGNGAAQRIIDALRLGDTKIINKQHKDGVDQAAAIAHNAIHQPLRETMVNGVHTFDLGLNDVAEVLRPKIQAAKKANKGQ